MRKNETLQLLARKYLRGLIPAAKKVGMEHYIEKLIEDNKHGTCIAEIEQVDMLSRANDDGYIKLSEIPRLVGKSYRYLFDNNIVYKTVRKFDKQGQYSKVDAILLAERLKR